MLTDDSCPPTARSSPPKPSHTNAPRLASLVLAPWSSVPLPTPPASPVLTRPRPAMTQSAASSTLTAYSRDDAKPPATATGTLSTQPLLSTARPPAPLPIPVPAPGSSRTGSRDSSRRRLTTSLVQVLKGKRAESSGSASGAGANDETGQPTTTTATATATRRASNDELPLSAPRSVPHLSRAGTANNSSVLLPPSPPPPPSSPGLNSSPPPPPSPPRLSKPPVSFPNFLRRRLSSASDAESPASQPPLIRRTSSQELLSAWTNRPRIFGRRSSNATPPTDDLVPSRTRAMSEEIQRPGFEIAANGFSNGLDGAGESGRPALRARASSVANGTPANVVRGSGARPSSGYGFSATPTATVNGVALASEEELDLGGFAAQETATLVPSAPFSSVSITRVRPSFISTSTRPSLRPAESPRPASFGSAPSSPPASPAPSGHLFTRNQRRNIDNLHLADFARISPPLSMRASPGSGGSGSMTALSEQSSPASLPSSNSTILPSTALSVTSLSSTTDTASAVAVDDDAPPVAPPTSPSTGTARRLRGLPRLLSTDGYAFPTLRTLSTSSASPSVSPPVDDAGGSPGSETETDTEHDDTETDTDDGDASDDFASADEGHQHPATPVTPRLGSQPLGAPVISPVAPTNLWVTFNPFTPTPGPLPTARPSDASAGAASYFDLPRGSSSGGGQRTPGGPLMSPLLPMSMSSAARGKRPTRQDDALPSSPASAETSGLQIYRRRSHSAVNILSPSLGSSDGEHVGTAAIEGLDPIWRSGVPQGAETPAPSFLSPSLVPPQTPLLSPAVPRLGRPRSMYELHVAPPAYHSVYIRPGLKAGQIVFPREEEGQEGLPDYTCAVHFEAYMPRKMEFTAPTVQAKDRAWKRQYVVLHGTAIKIYKHDLRTHPIPGEEDWAGATPSMAGSDGPLPLHFHVGEYGADAPPKSKFTTSIVDAKSRIAAPSHGNNVLLRHYSLQNAESGLAADYIKRKHAVRVRAEGEQFLLQAKDDRGVIDLIEALQAATNVALDLDTRLPPKFITLPRRRRRRRRPEGDAAGGPTPVTATGAAENLADESRLGDMLAEEQTAYAGRPGATVL